MMDAKLKKLLMQRSTLYKNISSDVVFELSKLSDDMGVESKKIVGLFDKFMTVSRQNSTSVTLDDVEAFAKEQTVLLAKTKSSSVFAKTEWDEYVIVISWVITRLKLIRYKYVQDGCVKEPWEDAWIGVTENITFCAPAFECFV
jgi:hypothetical protein